MAERVTSVFGGHSRSKRAADQLHIASMAQDAPNTATKRTGASVLWACRCAAAHSPSLRPQQPNSVLLVIAVSPGQTRR